MRITSPLLLSAFLATATGQTLTYGFPSTGPSVDGQEYYQVCVKGAKWADLITTNYLDQEEFRYDVSSLNFKNGDKMDIRWAGRYAVNIPDSFPCKGGILFQKDAFSMLTDLDLTLKATLADGESKLTVCALYYEIYPGNWAATLPALGFTESLDGFQVSKPDDYGSYFDPTQVRVWDRVKTLCRDFEPGVDEGFSETKPLPATVSYTFPEVGPTRIMQGICINGAQFASATNSVVDYPKYEMSTRRFGNLSNMWWDRYWWETNRNTGYGVPFAEYGWAPHSYQWQPGNPCDGSLYLQPQRQEQTGYFIEEPRWKNQYLRLSDADKDRMAKNEITVNILPKENESFVQICAIVNIPYETSNWLKLGEDYGFTTDGEHAAMQHYYVYCKDVAVPPTTTSQEPPVPPTTTLQETPISTDNTRVTLKLHL